MWSKIVVLSGSSVPTTVLQLVHLTKATLKFECERDSVDISNPVFWQLGHLEFIVLNFLSQDIENKLKVNKKVLWNSVINVKF
mgnify:CR=1 FL=1